MIWAPNLMMHSSNPFKVNLNIRISSCKQNLLYQIEMNYQLSHYQLSTIHYPLSIINYQLYYPIIFTTNSFIKEASEVPVLLTPILFKLYSCKRSNERSTPS